MEDKMSISTRGDLTNPLARTSWFSSVAALALIGCGPDDRAGTPPAAKDYEVLICAVSPEGDPTELFVLPAMNKTLSYYPDFAAELGMDTVATCEDGRAFMEGYRRYSDAHPGFDLDEPLGELTTPADTPQGDPTLTISKIINAQPHNLGAYPNEPVVRISFALDPPPGRFFCTGVFIAKNWIATAAHCLLPATDQGPPPSAPFDFETVGLPGGGIPAARLWGYARWKVEWADANGRESTDPAAVIQDDAETILQYPHPQFKGFTATTNDTDHDLALLYVDKSMYDRLLPPNAHDGSAMRISLRAPDKNIDQLSYEGFQTAIPPQTPPLQRGDLIMSQVAVNTQTIETLLTDASPKSCVGDSGGPLYRMTTGTNSVPVLHGVLASTLNGQLACAQTGETDQWKRVDQTVLPFIEKAMQIWNGDGFTCKQPTPSADYVQCWGDPCDLITDCQAGEFCSRPGLDLGGEFEDCETCHGACSCIVGQCLPTP
jgi:hypothetical protein